MVMDHPGRLAQTRGHDRVRRQAVRKELLEEGEILRQQRRCSGDHFITVVNALISAIAAERENGIVKNIYYAVT